MTTGGAAFTNFFLGLSVKYFHTTTLLWALWPLLELFIIQSSQEISKTSVFYVTGYQTFPILVSQSLMPLQDCKNEIVNQIRHDDLCVLTDHTDADQNMEGHTPVSDTLRSLRLHESHVYNPFMLSFIPLLFQVPENPHSEYGLTENIQVQNSMLCMNMNRISWNKNVRRICLSVL